MRQLFNNHIEINPEICHGKPVFAGTRIPVHLILELLGAGQAPADIIRDAYPQLTLEAIDAALQFAARAMEIGGQIEAGAIRIYEER